MTNRIVNTDENAQYIFLVGLILIALSNITSRVIKNLSFRFIQYQDQFFHFHQQQNPCYQKISCNCKLDYVIFTICLPLSDVKNGVNQTFHFFFTTQNYLLQYIFLYLNHRHKNNFATFQQILDLPFHISQNVCEFLHLKGTANMLHQIKFCKNDNVQYDIPENWDPGVGPQGGTLGWDTGVGPQCGTMGWDLRVGQQRLFF